MPDLKRFALFVYDTYYPSGGWHDFENTYEFIRDAEEKFEKITADCTNENGHIVDLVTGTVVRNLYYSDSIKCKGDSV